MTTKLAEYNSLRASISKLENDPELQAQIDCTNSILKVAKDLSISPDGAFRLLAPNLEVNSSPLTVKGLTRLPLREDKKLALHSDLIELQKKVKVFLEKLEEDPIMVKRQQLIAEAEAHQLTPIEAAALIDPERYERAVAHPKVKDKKTSTKGQRPMRYWQNPNTGQIVSGRSANQDQIQRWALEHGRAIIEDWLISEKKALSEK
jgi:hypothetical protein